MANSHAGHPAQYGHDESANVAAEADLPDHVIGNFNVIGNFSLTPVSSAMRGVMQAKLLVNRPGDEYEEEADHIAMQVMAIPNVAPNVAQLLKPLSRHHHPSPHAVHGPMSVQPKPVSDAQGATDDVPPKVFDVLQTSGQALDGVARQFFEPRFGRDFSQVRVHGDTQAGEAARSIRAKAFTVGNHIVFGSGQYASSSHAGRHLLAHELTHVVQQSGISGAVGLIQRTPEQANTLISQHTSWGNLDETALGRELLQLALGGQLDLADEVLSALGSTDRDDVAYELMVAITASQLSQLAGAASSRPFLFRLFDELTSGSVSAEEQQQADRILQVTARRTVGIGSFDAAATSRSTKVFPFRLPGFTVLNDAPIQARRVRGGIWVHSFVRVLGTAQFRAETATLPTQYFLDGIVLPENEVIGVRLYDQGGMIHYTTPLFLLQLANATDQRTLEKILEAVGIGLTLGTGALAGLGIEASMTARVLLWADRAAFVLGTVTSALREHRSWLVSQFGPGFADAVDTLNSATAIYGLARVVFQAPRILAGLRNGYQSLRSAAQSRASGFSSGEQATLRQITQNTDELLTQIDHIEGARAPAHPAAAAEPVPGPAAAEPAPRSAAPRSAAPRSAAPREAAPREAAAAPPEPARAPAAAAAGAGAAPAYRPTQAELEGYADVAWRALGGRGPRPAVVELPLPPDVRGQFGSSPPVIEVGTGAPSPGSAIDTVWHEASHGRIRELIGFMNEHLGASWQRTLLRPLDEMVSYFIGGLGRVIQGPTLSSRLYGVLSMAGAPLSAVGSMATTAERALWALHMLPLAAAMIWAEIRILQAVAERRARAGQPVVAPPPAPTP